MYRNNPFGSYGLRDVLQVVRHHMTGTVDMVERQTKMVQPIHEFVEFDQIYAE